jgi:hypothetical protein
MRITEMNENLLFSQKGELWHTETQEETKLWLLQQQLLLSHHPIPIFKWVVGEKVFKRLQI